VKIDVGFDAGFAVPDQVVALFDERSENLDLLRRALTAASAAVSVSMTRRAVSWSMMSLRPLRFRSLSNLSPELSSCRC